MKIITEHHTVHQNSLPYLIAEIGLNHNGSLQLATTMAKAAKDAGADCVKFQIFSTEHFIQPQARIGEGSLGDFFKQFTFTPEEWRELRTRVAKLDIDFLCSVFDEPSLEVYRSLSPWGVKIASCDINHKVLLQKAGQAGMPVLLSTGTADEDEVKRAFRWINRPKETILFQCVSSYPADDASFHLSLLPVWQNEYSVMTGISDHTMENYISFASVALGAKFIERHFTIDRSMQGPDQALSLDPVKFKELAVGCRAIHAAIGTPEKKIRPSELAVSAGGRRTLCATRDIKAGEEIQASDVIALRPGGGIPADLIDEITGKRLSIDCKQGTPFPLTLLK